MLTLLVDNFDDYTIVPIFTQKAKDSQTEVLKDEKIYGLKFDNGFLIEDENLYDEVFKTLNDALSNTNYDELVVDLTHGFRHLPILAIISLIIQNIKNPDKIKHILFAKEMPSHKEYEIIDLRDYLGLAKLSFVLANFNKNYTVGNKLTFNDQNYQELVDNLRIISSHILGNSIQALMDGDNSLISETIIQFKALMDNDENIKNFSTQINEIIEHLEEIEKLKDEINYIKLFKLSQVMSIREYLLNSITLLNESIGLYCAKRIENISDEIKNHISTYLNNSDSNLYELAHQSKNIIKNEKNFAGDYLFEPNKDKLTSGQKTSLQKKKKKLKEKISSDVLQKIKEAGFKIELSAIDTKKDRTIKNKIISHLKDQDNSKLIALIIDAEKLRNNLAHGNSSEKIGNVKAEVSRLLKEFESFL